MQGTKVPYGDNFIFVIPVDGEPLHTPDKPFCFYPTCPCHEDHDNLTEVSVFVTDGLMTEREVANFVAGKGI